MSLTPDDIVNYPLKQSVRGYSVRQVDELLDQVADALERAQTRMADLERRLALSEQQLASSSETETTLKRTLVTAQRAAEQSMEEAKERATEIIEDARREAEVIVEEARLETEQLRLEAVRAARAEEAETRRRRQEIERHVESLRVFERDYRARLRSHLEEHLRMLDDLDAPPEPEPLPDLLEPTGDPGGEPSLRGDRDVGSGRWSDPASRSTEDHGPGGDAYDWLAGPTPSGSSPDDAERRALFGPDDEDEDEDDAGEPVPDDLWDGPRLTVRVREDEVEGRSEEPSEEHEE